MKLPIELFLLGSLSLLSSARNVEPDDQASLNDWLQQYDMVLVEFSSGSLDTLQPFHTVFQEASQHTDVAFVTIDCDQEKDLCAEYKVVAYPAIRLLRRSDDGEILSTRYRGKKTRRAIVSFVTKASLPPVTHIETGDLQKFKEIDDIVIVAYIRPDQEDFIRDFKATALRFHNEFVFGLITDKSLADAEGLKMPSIASYKADGDNRSLNGPFGVPEIETFLQLVKKDIIGEFTERNIETYMAKNKLTAYIFAKNEEDVVALRRALTPLAKTFEQVVTFGLVDAVEYAPMARNYGLVEDIFPAFVVHAPMNDNIFLYKQGKAIRPETVEIMLRTILQAKATNGQVFGTEGPDYGRNHDEL